MATYVITGANRGIGLELCRQAANAGNDVIGVCRNSSPELAEVARVEDGIDVGDDEVVPLLKTRLEGVKIDVLINNAGILSRETLPSPDWNRIRQQFEINSLGPLRVTSALIDNLKPGSKVAIVTSRMGSIGDNTSGGSYGYRMSKAAVNAASVSLANDLKPSQVAVAVLHPGWVRTEMTGGRGKVEVHDAAAGLLARIDELSLETTGTFWHQNGERLPW